MTEASPGWAARIIIGCIRLYQRFLSPFLGQNCRFYPTCSHYGVEALRVHGLFVGSALTLWRILRCQPFTKGGIDPVPERRRREPAAHPRS